MDERHVPKIAAELGLTARQVQAAAELIAEGAAVPFIARYRKEVTGSLDEVQITAIRDRLDQLADLDKRREAILKSLQERELLTDDLKEKILSAETLSVLEDIYLPFRPKRRTRATVARERGLDLALRLTADLPVVRASADMLGEALGILLTNACNYTPAGGKVIISTATRQNGKKLPGISVEDSGPGIAPEDIPHLFERFYRGKVGLASGMPGTGLGLAIAHEIVQRHQGEIEIVSEGVSGRGCKVNIWLPTA